MSGRYGPSLVAGKGVYGVTGLGIPAAVIRATTADGDYGPGLLYNEWDSSADDAKALRALIVTPPAAGTLFVFEDGSFTLTGAPDGSYSLTYRVFVDGVDQGTAVASFTLGPPATFAITNAGGIASTAAVGAPVFSFDVPAPGSSFSVVGAGGIASTAAVGTPVFSFDAPSPGFTFTVTNAGGIASTAAVGTPVFSFDVPAPGFTFAVSAAGGIASTAAVGAPTFNFLVDAGPEEPVTWAEARLSCRIEADELEPEVLSIISAAREQAEHITGRVYRRSTQPFELPTWPAEPLRVPQPVAVAISYWSDTGWQALPEGQFDWAAVGPATALAPPLGGAWPALAPRAVGGRVRISITAGPASRADVPACVKRYILANVAAWLANPEAASARGLSPSPLYDHLLDRERLWL